MARSIHTTRRTVAEHERDDHRDAGPAAAERRRLAAELRLKRLIKAEVVAERRRERPDGAVVDPATIPIHVLDEAPHVVHAASPADVLGVLRRLPPGIVDGLGGITLSLGRELQRTPEPDEETHVDPRTGRLSFEFLPGMFMGRVLGCYQPERAHIVLAAYACDPTAPPDRVVHLLMRLQTLATLVHEVAHHHDHHARTGRGRWLADDAAHVEIYAERMEHTWAQTVVVSYAEAELAGEVAHLRAWLVAHAGVEVPLGFFLEDPRLTRDDGTVRFRFGTRGAVERLVSGVAAGDDPIDLRIDFAEQIHWDETYDLPRAILAAVLAEVPGDPRAVVLLGDLDVHEGRGEDAEARARDAIAREPDYREAWMVLVDALALQARWPEMVAAAESGIELAGGDAYQMARFVFERARARIELGDRAGFEREVMGLALGRMGPQRFARRLLERWDARWNDGG